MTKAELVSEIAEQSDLTQKAADSVLKSLIRIIHDSLKKNGAISITGLGRFRVLQTKARIGVHPQTLKKINIPASKVPRFSAAKSLREAVKGLEKKTEKKKK